MKMPTFDYQVEGLRAKHGDYSTRLQRQIPPQPNQCWVNSFRAYYPAQGLFGEVIYYAEGLLLVGWFVTPHAWLETEDGRIIDPTLGEDRPDRYVTAARWTMPQLYEELDDPEGARLPVLNFDVINSSPGIEAAYRLAYRAVGGPEMETRVFNYHGKLNSI